MPTQDELKQQVARRAAQFVENGMRLGLGTGSTAKLFVDELAGDLCCDRGAGHQRDAGLLE